MVGSQADDRFYLYPIAIFYQVLILSLAFPWQSQKSHCFLFSEFLSPDSLRLSTQIFVGDSLLIEKT